MHDDKNMGLGMTIQPINTFGQMFDRIFKSNLKTIKEVDVKSCQQTNDKNSHQEEPTWSSSYKEKNGIS